MISGTMVFKHCLSFFLFLILFFNSLILPLRASQTVMINVDSNRTFQTMTGWETVAYIGEVYSDAFPLYKEAVLDSAIFSLGINRVRVEIRSGNENSRDYWTEYRSGLIPFSVVESTWYLAENDNIDPLHINPAGFQFSELDEQIEQVVLPMKRRLKKLGENLFLNICFVDFGSSNFEHKKYPFDYAEFVLATYLHLQKKYDLVPDAWEIILEPDNIGQWSPLQIVDAMRVSANLLIDNGFTPAFIVPSCMKTTNAIDYFLQIVQNPVVRPYISEFSYHLYAYGTDENRIRIGEISEKYGVKTAQLEWIGGSYRELLSDLKLASVSAWAQYALADQRMIDDGCDYYMIDTSMVNQPAIITGRRTFFLKHFFRYIRRDAVRIECTSSDSLFNPVAFINPNGKYAIVIRGETGAELSISGLPPGYYSAVYTSDERKKRNYSPKSIFEKEDFTIEILGSGMLTVYAN